MSRESSPEERNQKKRYNGVALVVFVISTVAFVGNMLVWAFDISVDPKDVVSFDFGVLFFLVSFVVGGRFTYGGNTHTRRSKRLD